MKKKIIIIVIVLLLLIGTGIKNKVKAGTTTEPITVQTNSSTTPTVTIPAGANTATTSDGHTIYTWPMEGGGSGWYCDNKNYTTYPPPPPPPEPGTGICITCMAQQPPAPACGGPCDPNGVQCPQNCSQCQASSYFNGQPQGYTCQGVQQPTATPVPACGADCTNNPNRCVDIAGCNQCLPNPNGQGKTCQQPPACGRPCQQPADCQGAQDGCTVCGANKTCTPPPQPTATPAPVCGADCTNNPNICDNIAGCNVCANNPNGQGKTCQPPAPTATPTPVPACGMACNIPADCQAAHDGCTTCIANKCSAPPTPTPTPLPFSEDMCKCDGITLDPPTFSEGQELTVTAFSKVEGVNTNYAAVDKMLFNSGHGVDPNIIRDIPFDNPIAVSIDSQNNDKVRYKAVWKYKVPTKLDPSLTYRIWSDPQCIRKVAFAPIAANRVVLGTSTQNQGFFGAIFNFFANIFGFGENNTAQQTINSEPTPTSNPNKKTLQLETLKFGSVVETDSCRYIKFRVTQ